MPRLQVVEAVKMFNKQRLDPGGGRAVNVAESELRWRARTRCSYTGWVEGLVNGLISSKSVRSLMLGGVTRAADEGLEGAD